MSKSASQPLPCLADFLKLQLLHTSLLTSSISCNLCKSWWREPEWGTMYQKINKQNENGSHGDRTTNEEDVRGNMIKNLKPFVRGKNKNTYSSQPATLWLERKLPNCTMVQALHVFVRVAVMLKSEVEKLDIPEVGWNHLFIPWKMYEVWTHIPKTTSIEFLMLDNHNRVPE